MRINDKKPQSIQEVKTNDASHPRERNGLFHVLATVWEAIKNFFLSLFSSGNVEKTKPPDNHKSPPPSPSKTLEEQTITGKMEEASPPSSPPLVLKKEKFSFLEEIKQLLGSPQIKSNNLKEETRVFVEKIESIFIGFINESVTLSINHEETIVKGKIDQPSQLHLVFEFIEGQLKLFNQLLNEEKCIDINAFFGKFTDLNQLMEIWENLCLLSSEELDSDQKISLLKGIDNSLTEKDSAIWKKYPKMLERIQISFDTFRGKPFSNRGFDVIKDKEIIDDINDTYARICTKLGESPHQLQLKMYTKNDKPIAEEKQKSANTKIVDNIVAAHCESGAEEAATILLTSLPSEMILNEKVQYAEKILEEIDKNISPLIESAFYNLLYQD